MKLLNKAYLMILLLFLYAPIFVLIVFSFNESKSSAHWTGFSWKWYIRLFNNDSIRQALTNTLMVAVLAALFATILGTAAAMGIQAMGKTSRKILLNITNIPVLNPDIVTGVSLMILYVFCFRLFRVGNLGFVTLLLSHIAFNVPYVILSVLPKLRQLDPNMYEAALDLGAPPFYAFFKVILPEIMPGVITGAMLSFTLSIDDFVVSFFTTGPGVNTLSTIIYSMARRGINPEINALSAIMFVVVLAMLFVINLKDENRIKGEDAVHGNASI